MPSFDIVCEVDMQEVDNAVNQTDKEIGTRFDFRGSKSSISLNKENQSIHLVADDEMKLRSLTQILESKIARRGLDCRVLDYQPTVDASSNTLKQAVNLKSGIDKPDAKKITKLIKESGFKVQAQIQDQQVRVTGKKIDDLQAVIAKIKETQLGLPLQFVNMRN
ncbi:MAG: YajQ family cyclic di-GMP-binding protein [Zetaproteobacteria bacterium]|nr:YajQ family cyclic di-GMP-binding protein [Zetaproteobacteria bacterium]